MDFDIDEKYSTYKVPEDFTKKLGSFMVTHDKTGLAGYLKSLSLSYEEAFGVLAYQASTHWKESAEESRDKMTNYLSHKDDLF